MPMSCSSTAEHDKNHKQNDYHNFTFNGIKITHIKGFLHTASDDDPG